MLIWCTTTLILHQLKFQISFLKLKPNSLKNLSRNSFWKTIRTKLIDILETENSYDEIDAIIDKMKNKILTEVKFSL